MNRESQGLVPWDFFVFNWHINWHIVNKKIFLNFKEIKNAYK
jgi:hypothetical protein